MPRHVARGVIGVLCTVAAFVLFGVIGPVSLLGLPLAGLAWRGCPTCWAVGMAGALRDSRHLRE